jgi:hypothetical protein
VLQFRAPPGLGLLDQDGHRLARPAGPVVDSRPLGDRAGVLPGECRQQQAERGHLHLGQAQVRRRALQPAATACRPGQAAAGRSRAVPRPVECVEHLPQLEVRVIRRDFACPEACEQFPSREDAVTGASHVTPQRCHDDLPVLVAVAGHRADGLSGAGQASLEQLRAGSLRQLRVPVQGDPQPLHDVALPVLAVVACPERRDVTGIQLTGRLNTRAHRAQVLGEDFQRPVVSPRRRDALDSRARPG